MKKTYKNQLPKGMEVQNTNVRIENGELVVEVEFKERFEPKDGDFLVDNDGEVFIFQETASNCHYGCYVGTLPNGKIKIGDSHAWVHREGCRYATPEEKSAFLERLEKECHKTWNAEKKCLEDIRWRANHGQRYYIVSGMCEITSYEDYCSATDDGLYKLGNYFRTPEAAQKVADQIKEIFKNSKAE